MSEFHRVLLGAVYLGIFLDPSIGNQEEESSKMNDGLGQGDGMNPYSAPTADQVTGGTAPGKISVKELLTSFEGRISRSQYWMGVGIQIAVIIPVVIVGAIGSATTESEWVFIGLLLALMPPYIWTGLAIQIKRWHDHNKGGIWVLINLIPYIGGIWSFIMCGCLRGTTGPNQFGPDPVSN